MSKKFKFKSGYTGAVSDKVAEILSKKGEGYIVKDKQSGPPPSGQQGNTPDPLV